MRSNEIRHQFLRRCGATVAWILWTVTRVYLQWYLWKFSANQRAESRINFLTRCTQFLVRSLSSLSGRFTAGMPEKSDKATEATYLFDHYRIGLNLHVRRSRCSRIRWYGLWAFSRPKINDYWQAENRWLAGVAFPNLSFPINGTFTHISNVYPETLKRPSIKCTERTN